MTNNECRVSDWKPFRKGCMVGSFTLHTPSGLVIHDIALFENGASRFIGMPRQRYVTKEGEERFTTIIEFRDRKSADVFRELALQALDKALGRKVA